MALFGRAMMGRAADAFDPSDISGLLAWWDANDPENDGSPPSNGATLTAWNDRSGNGRNLTAVGSPTYNASTAAFNNQPTIEFAGASQGFASTSPFMFANGTIEVWAVIASDNANNGHIFAEASSTDDDPLYRVYDQTAGGGEFFFNYRNASAVDRFNLSPTKNNTNVAQLIIATDRGAAGAAGLEVVDTDANGSGAYTRDAITVNRLAVGLLRRATDASFFNGRMGVILVYSAELGSTDAADLTAWLNARYNKTWTPA